MDLLYIAAGIGLLYLGGEGLVRGAVALARVFGLSPMVIGLTVVSFGTSSPELAATLTAALRGAPEVAFGNVVGSNVANIGLILGLTAMIWPLATRGRFLRREMPFMLLASALLFPLVANGVVSRLEGVGLLAILVLFLGYLLRTGDEYLDIEEEFSREFAFGATPALKALAFVAIGIACLVLGAKLLIAGAIAVARDYGVSERVIGLTMVAIGTSLPELAASVVAAVKRQGDIVLGNIIGSNVFNALCILGATALVEPVRIEVPSAHFDLAVMLGLSVLVWPFLATRMRLERWEGAVLFAVYWGYMGWLFL